MGDIWQRGYFKAADKIAFLVFSGILLSWIVYFSFFHIPAFYNLLGDPDCVYAANAILLAGGEKVNHTDHPGTIVQVIGACIALVLGIDKSQIFEPESYNRIFLGWRIFVLVTVVFVLLKLWKGHTQNSKVPYHYRSYSCLVQYRHSEICYICCRNPFTSRVTCCFC